MYDEQTCQPVTRLGQPIPRGAAPTPCDACPKCPAGEAATPATGRQSELSAKNWQALSHFVATRHDGLTEAEKGDPLIRKNRKILENLFMHNEHRLLSEPKLAPLVVSSSADRGRLTERLKRGRA